ncbi:hypothetical protein BKP56_07275 [Marinilactibacillus sp. 15R]|uniref:hypothetical protein n=1 Tax=Marinilactibacillus sp. 15R TaxID=1911586 RepID=UPI00090A8D41|nr:hypothetical protein [Marinilactibacillus sp. 15R]API89065.1 hypothetical protein BKP56_07275 [Marinilactibacillus sp. 15R]
MWDMLFFNKQNIEYETDKAMLIKMPNKSNYKGWMFWHPKSLINEEGGKGYYYSFRFPNSWDFKLIKKYKNGEEKQLHIEVSEMVAALKDSDGSIRSCSPYSSESYYKEKEPEKIIIKKVEVDESLIR